MADLEHTFVLSAECDKFFCRLEIIGNWLFHEDVNAVFQARAGDLIVEAGRYYDTSCIDPSEENSEIRYSLRAMFHGDLAGLLAYRVGNGNEGGIFEACNLCRVELAKVAGSNDCHVDRCTH